MTPGPSHCALISLTFGRRAGGGVWRDVRVVTLCSQRAVGTFEAIGNKELTRFYFTCWYFSLLSQLKSICLFEAGFIFFKASHEWNLCMEELEKQGHCCWADEYKFRLDCVSGLTCTILKHSCCTGPKSEYLMFVVIHSFLVKKKKKKSPTWI